MKILKAAAVAVATILMPVTAATAAERAIIVLDGSGSMWGQIEGVPKLEIARSALRDVLENAPANLELGLMAYGHREKGNCADIELLVPPHAKAGENIIAAADKMKFLGKTPISAAVRQAADALRFTEDKATVILITDGIETCEADPCAIAAELEDRGMDFTAHVVGFGLSEDEGRQVSCLAKTTGGRYFPAGNAAELTEALTHVQTVMKTQEQAQPEPDPEPQVEAAVELDGPEQVTTGAVFDFAWTGAINGHDFITVVPADADADTVKNHIRVKDDDEGRLTAPGTPGLYELRYVLNEGRRTLASVPVEVTEAEVGLSGPEQVTTGAVFDFAWTGAINGHDFITVVPADADADTVKNHIRVKDDDEGRLTAPGTPGLYELRYVLNEGRRTLASVPVEVIEAEVGIAGPGVVRAGTDVDITWSATINRSDFITIVPTGSDEGKVETHIRTREATEGRIKAPETVGLYEIRYVLNEGRGTLASASLEVVAADAPLDDGAGLSAPAQAGVGDTITVSWTGGSDGADQRISLARADQPDFSWIAAHKVGADKTMELEIPEEAGRYEVRYLDISGRKVLGRAIVDVK